MNSRKIVLGAIIIIANSVFFSFVYWAMQVSSNHELQTVAFILAFTYTAIIVLSGFGIGPLSRIEKRNIQREKVKTNERLRAKQPWE